MMSNSRFTQDGHVVHRAKPQVINTAEHDERMPVHVGNIISPEWLAAQMGLPVDEVQERLTAAERRIDGQEDRPVCQVLA